jgi:RNA polymerase sigma factor (sigma-70 family)
LGYKWGVEERSNSSDAELLRAVADGDTGALRMLHERHSAWLTVRLLRRCNDRQLVAEVVQDTFVAVWRGAGSYRGEGEVGGWLWGVAIRRLVARLRSHSRLAEVLVPEVATGTDVSAEDRVLAGVEYGDAGAALARLSPEMRAVIQATVLDGLTTREAGQLLGLPRATVKTRLYRAKAQLRRDLVEGSA